MNKKFIQIFIIIALLVSAIYYSKEIQSPILSSLNYIKLSYLNILTSINNTIKKHFFQAQRIEELNKKLKNYEQNNIIMIELASELNDLYYQNNSKLSTNPKVELVRVISYQKFGNKNHLWIDIKDYNSSKIYGLIYKDSVAGIVVPKNNKPLALLNQDMKSTYSVFIGNAKAPGIAHGNNDKNIIINFIPAWFKINKGDEVITSSLDNIFLKGLKVGKVVEVTKSQGYQNAIVKPYYTSNEPNYFYLIRDIK